MTLAHRLNGAPAPERLGQGRSAPAVSRSPIFMPTLCAGVAWWNRRAVTALLSVDGPAAPPVFFRTVEDALAAAPQGAQIYAWASKAGDKETAAARRAGIDLIRIEDGFLRSVGLGAGLAPACSFAVDRRGIHFDARQESDLEHLLATRDLSPEETARGYALRRAILAARLSKYNVEAGGDPSGIPWERGVILVPGQVAGDASLRFGLIPADYGTGSDMNLALLRAVRQRNPDAFILYKPHPDVEAGLRPGALPEAAVLAHADCILRGGDIAALLARCAGVETLTSLTGFEALLRGKRVTCHGAPFYAGWGLTEDLVAVPRRTRRRSIDELVFIAMALYCRSLDPAALKPCTPERLIEALSTLKRSPAHRARMAVCRHASRLGRRLGL